VESRSGRARTPRKRVRWQHLRGFKSHLHRHCDLSRHRKPLNLRVSLRGQGFPVVGLVVAVGVEDEFAEEFAGRGGDDTAVGSSDADADVVQTR
jgi:hypothetical protein